MDCAPDIATTLESWLKNYSGDYGDALAGPVFREISAPADPSVIAPALAALAAEALARNRTLWIVTANDALLPELSNALDLRLRPLCLVLPGAEYAGRIALRATLSLLKSRLARAAEDSDGPAWLAMREHLSTEDALWRDCLAWSKRGLDRELPPAGIGRLFPVHIGPCSSAEPWRLANNHEARADWVMLIQSPQLPPSLRTPWPGARCTLMLAAGPISGTTGLMVNDATMHLRAEIEVLGQELAELELELATAQGELAEVNTRYQAKITWRMTELDRLHADLATLRTQQAPDDPALDAAARQASVRAEQSRRENESFKASQGPSEVPETRFSPSTDLKKLYRQLAQKIHPDRARDETERTWRTQLMSEANRAYRAGDMAALDELLTLWLEGQAGSKGTPESSDAVPPAPTFSEADVLAAQAERIRRRIAMISSELDQLYGSKLYELFSAMRMAARQGRDLLEEMAERLDRQIAAAQESLDRLATI